MPSPGAPAPLRLPIEDSYFELLADTLESLDLPARGQFLQRYFRAIAHLDLRETQSVQIWDEMLARRRELTDLVGRQVSLKTALTDVLSSSGLLRVPILIEYDELKRLELNAVTDPLTGLHNRRLFAETFEKELNRARRYSQPLGLVTLDLHRFKEVNDQHGHPRGDDVLRAAAATLKNALCRRVETVFAEMLQTLQLAVTVGMDHGVAIFPQDAEQADQLIRIADERLYRLKQANHSKSGNGSSRTESPSAPDAPAAPAPQRAAPASPPISIETKRAPDKTETTIAAAASATSAAISADLTVAPSRVFAVQRKAERVSMTGTNAYAVLGDQGVRRARVLDLGFGGVAMEVDSAEDLPENLLAVLHVPILPPVRVNLKPVWKQLTDQGGFRVGCAFVS